MLSEKIEIVTRLSNRMPSGLNDPKAMSKFASEMEEVMEAITEKNFTESIMEAGDMMYYLIKARHQDLIGATKFYALMDYTAQLVNVSQDTILEALLVKLRLRIRPGNPKHPDDERAEVYRLVTRPLLEEEAMKITYLLIEAGKMATKSRVEAIMMARLPSLDKTLAHDILNGIEYHNENKNWYSLYPLTWKRGAVAEPKPEDYPEIQEMIKDLGLRM